MLGLFETGDGDVGALEKFQLVNRGAIGSEVDGLVRVADARSVVVETDLAPRFEIDQVPIHGFLALRARGHQLPGADRRHPPPSEFPHNNREREHGQEVACRRILVPDFRLDTSPAAAERTRLCTLAASIEGA